MPVRHGLPFFLRETYHKLNFARFIFQLVAFSALKDQLYELLKSTPRIVSPYTSASNANR